MAAVRWLAIADVVLIGLYFVLRALATVIVMTVVSWLINRAAGVPVPVWVKKQEPSVSPPPNPSPAPRRRPAVE